MGCSRCVLTAHQGVEAVVQGTRGGRPLACVGQVFADSLESARCDGGLRTDRVVLKSHLTPAAEPALERSRFMVDLDTQTVASGLAMAFNEATASARRVGTCKHKGVPYWCWVWGGD